MATALRMFPKQYQRLRGVQNVKKPSIVSGDSLVPPVYLSPGPLFTKRYDDLATRLNVLMIVSLWNLTGISAGIEKN